MTRLRLWDRVVQGSNRRRNDLFVLDLLCYMMAAFDVNRITYTSDKAAHTAQFLHNDNPGKIAFPPQIVDGIFS